MNPKEMSKESLIVAGMNGSNSAKAELLHRLDDADALRKENEELRKENEELKEKVYFFARTFRYYAGEAFRFYEKHPLARETDETRAANIIKESEASHDR